MQAITEQTTANPLDDRIAEVIARLANALRSHEWQAARPHGLTPTQSQTLTLLQQREPSPVRVGDAASQLGVSPATASDTIATLVRKQLVTRQSASADRRAVELRLTPAGREAASAVAHARDFLTQAVASLPETSRIDMLTMLMRLSAALERDDHVPPARMCLSCSHFMSSPGERGHHYCAAYQCALADADLRVDCSQHRTARGNPTPPSFASVTPAPNGARR